MSEKVVVTKSYLEDIGKQIIAKGGASAPLLPSQMAAAIEAIPSGSAEPEYPLPWRNDGKTHLWFYFYPNSDAYAYFTAQYISDGHTFEVDWGDGTIVSIDASSAYTTRALSHTYADEGLKEVVISGYDAIKASIKNPFGTVSVNNMRQVELGGNVDAISAEGWGNSIIAIGSDSAQVIGSGSAAGSFQNCSRLRVINFPNATIIEKSTFRNVNIEKLENLNSLISCGEGVFSNCNNLKSVATLPSITSIAVNAFVGCSSLKTIGDLPLVESLGYGCFTSCTSLESIGDMPLLNTIASSVFSNCISIASLTFSTKTHTDVMAITGFGNFPNRGRECVFHCSDGDFYRSGTSLLPL